MATKKRKIFYFLLLIATIAFAYCSRDASGGAETPKLKDGAAMEFESVKNDSVHYVGLQTCRSCHDTVYQTFHETGMGKSFDAATPEKTAATFDAHSLVYDKEKNFYYYPFFKDKVMYIKEFRMDGKDTVHSRTERISYIIGSGQHTNSHLINNNGYVSQAPITFYTQSGKWDLAPGFEHGASSRFERIITNECLTCHNHYPAPVAGSENKYAAMPTGIECERCHGPGEAHVKAKLAGKLVDTQKEADYSIVNPRRLPLDLQLDLCQRCHLQGVAVLNEGRSWYDFKPGYPLRNVLNVFLPRFTNSSEHFIMASQADRMRLSKCFTQGKMTCITCHNPHKSVKITGTAHFNDACLNCHIKDKKNKDMTLEMAANQVCTAPAAERAAKQNNCVDCHMPKVGSIDIPHVRISDHYIRKQMKADEKAAVAQFLGLECLTQKKPSPLLMAQGYIALYDKFISDKQMLDSANKYLVLSNSPIENRFKTNIHYLFAKNDMQGIVAAAAELPLEKISDGWTAYRVGDALLGTGDAKAAVPYLQKATELLPYFLEFRNKLGAAYLATKQLKKARQTLQFSIQENPKQAMTLSNLGYVTLMEGDRGKAMYYYNQALALDPDYDQAVVNKAGLLMANNDRASAVKLLEGFLKFKPNSEKAKQTLLQVNASL